MKEVKKLTGFSKLTKAEKLKIVADHVEASDAFMEAFKGCWHADEQQQQVFDEFSENTLTNFFLPYGVAPNFLINDRYYIVPMVIEESSVVAAAAKAAKFWAERGGFKAEVLSTTKVGHVHFTWQGNDEKLYTSWEALKKYLLTSTTQLTAGMQKRGGGIKQIALIDGPEVGYYQLKVTFETCDAMGANFINACLEEMSRSLKAFVEENVAEEGDNPVEVIMSILSNYTPECLVKSSLSCKISQLGCINGLSPEEFARKFEKAVKIAKRDVYRAVTHNKGIFNGIDAVAIATGNDFRAIEAGGHAYSARSGSYQSLTTLSLAHGIFSYELKIPLALGVVGGLTQLHPLVKWSLRLLGNPNVSELMKVVASVGLANNFNAVCSLITTGIQQGHMKMHLSNILNHFGVADHQKQLAFNHFKKKTVSFHAVREFLESKVAYNHADNISE
ncbi:MAG: hydroxymethylglutaryl-CoA reductase, degradative [Cytophagales bacterium]|nr:hydroxymethylglutaryl-CoA reductase, degradative [Cytophagales bacterium]